jgi:hypothetical protein
MVAGSVGLMLQMLVINLPFLAFASMTRNLLELVSGGVALGFLVAIVDALTSSTPSLEPVSRTGLAWILYLAAFAVLFLGAALVLRLQYVHRRTTLSRIWTGGFAVLFLLTGFMPWRLVFAIQRSLSSASASSRAVALNFDHAAGRFRPPVGALTPENAFAIARRGEGSVQVYLPFRVTGLPPDSAIQMDHAEIRLIANGRLQRLEQEPWNARREESGSPTQTVYPTLGIPAALYGRIKDQWVRVEVDYWMTLAQVTASHTLPAIDGGQRFPSVGPCRTKVNEPETAVRLSCVYPGTPPACLHSFLEYIPTGQRNPDRFGCGNYASFARLLLDPLFPGALVPFSVNLPFRDPLALAHFPVDGSKLRQSRAVIQFYRVQDHFTRRLVIPEIRLSEWGAETPGT